METATLNHPPQQPRPSSVEASNLTALTDRSAAHSLSEKFVVFYLDDELFAVPANSVTEVVQPPAMTSLPNSPVWLCGLANLRGEIMAILNLPKFCRKKVVLRSSKSRLIVFRPPQFDSPVAFLIDKIVEIVVFTSETITPAENIFLAGITKLNENPVNLLATEKIFTEISAN